MTAKMDKFGLELVLKAHQIDSKIKKLVVTLHWCLLKRGLRCAGSGENFSENSDAPLSEILPLNWSKDDNVFALKYRQESNHPNKFIFKILRDGEIANVFLLRMSDEATKTLSVDLVKVIGDDLNTPNEDELLKKAFVELLDDFLPLAPASQSQSSRPESSDPRVQGIPNPTPSAARNPQMGPDYDPLRIGGSDLDPLGRMGGGGMMMDPRRGRGGGMQGPNFDPVHPGMPSPFGGPPGPMPPGYRPRGGGPSARGGRGGGRDWGSELPPPGYDDMFM